jgi:CRP/FNR family transcriptional regulator
VFDGGNYPASASALEAAVLLFVSQKDFRSVCIEHPAGCAKGASGSGRPTANTRGNYPGIVVHHCLSSADFVAAATTQNGRRLRTSRASQQELASQIGPVRELVSRNLARLQAQGFISISGGEVTILRPAGLEADLSATV